MYNKKYDQIYLKNNLNNCLISVTKSHYTGNDRFFDVSMNVDVF
ncbi:hypothetical protein SAMN05444001_108168 [Parabacteroides chinchillae]|uniref:Uncharacterized protein n=1 Tax=Parabacteroides chinchillae TaxID=871327 RepID=A0A8G2FAV7_9BACT|nr:hypothetical protein SAMN05444001_108168 [Parabacteroides chinchillae]